jgi:hypothetical protein
MAAGSAIVASSADADGEAAGPNTTISTTDAAAAPAVSLRVMAQLCTGALHRRCTRLIERLQR